MKKIIKSKRLFDSDYSNSKIFKIDMSLSGKSLVKRKIIKMKADVYENYTNKFVENELIEKITKNHNIDKDNIVLGAGSNGIVQNLINILFVNNKEKSHISNIVVPFYSFDQIEYAVSVKKGVTYRIKNNDDFSINFENLEKAVNKDTIAIYICNPNNPTGIYESNEKILELAKKTKVPVIVDEATNAFSLQESLIKQKNLNNIIVIRTFSKEYALAGIRLGYAIMNKNLVKRYLKNSPQFEYSNYSINLVNKLFYEKYVNKNIQILIKEREKLYEELNSLGFEMIKSYSNTLMSKEPYSDEFYKILEEYGISIVKVKGENEGIYFRIAVQKQRINKKFIRVLKEIKESIKC